MTGKESVTALSLVVGTLLVVGGFAGLALGGEFDYRYEADYQSTNATHFLDNTTVDSVDSVTDFESLNDSQQEAVRQAENGSVEFSDRSEVAALPEYVSRSNSYAHYEVVATLDRSNSPALLSAGLAGAGLLLVLYALRQMNREGESDD